MGQLVMVPKAKFVVSDNFNRANGNLTAPWIQEVGFSGTEFYTIVSNQLQMSSNNSAGQSDAYVYDAPCSGQPQQAQVQVATIQTSNCGVVVRAGRVTNSAPAVYGLINSTGWSIATGTPGASGGSGGLTTIASGSATFTAGSTLLLTIDASNLATLRYGGTVLGTPTTISSAPTGLYTGLSMYASFGTTPTLDNWQAGDL